MPNSHIEINNFKRKKITTMWILLLISTLLILSFNYAALFSYTIGCIQYDISSKCVTNTTIIYIVSRIPILLPISIPISIFLMWFYYFRKNFNKALKSIKWIFISFILVIITSFSVSVIMIMIKGPKAFIKEKENCYPKACAPSPL